MSLTNKNSTENFTKNYDKNTYYSLSKNNEIDDIGRHCHHPYVKKYSQNLAESLNFFTDREINTENKKCDTIICRTPKKGKNNILNNIKDIHKPTYNKVNINDYSKKCMERNDNKKFTKNRRKQYKLNYLNNDRVVEKKVANSPFRNIQNDDDLFIRRITNGKDDMNEMKYITKCDLTAKEFSNTYNKNKNKKLIISKTNVSTLNNSFFNINNNNNYLNKKLMGYKHINKPVYRKNNSQLNPNKVQNKSTQIKNIQINNFEVNKEGELLESSYNFLKTDNNLDEPKYSHIMKNILIKKRPNHSIKSDNFNELFICKKNKGQFIEYPINLQNLPTINKLLNKLGFEISQIKHENEQHKNINYEIYNLNKSDLYNRSEDNGTILCYDCPSAPMSFDILMRMEEIKKTTNDIKDNNVKPATSKIINPNYLAKDLNNNNNEIKNAYKNKRMINKRMITSYNMNVEKNKKNSKNQLRKKGKCHTMNINQFTKNIINQNNCYFEENKNNNLSKKKMKILI
jgi:hypothetical protein